MNCPPEMTSYSAFETASSASSSSSCFCPEPSSSSSAPPLHRSVSTTVVLETVVITTAIALAFVVTKSSYDRLRLMTSRATAVVIGAGPAGLLSAWIIAETGKATRIIVYEELGRADVVARSKYLCLDPTSVRFLRSVGLQVAERVPGRWQHQNFVTKTGLFLEHVLDALRLRSRWKDLVEVRFETKFTKESLKELDSLSERIVAVVCDGSSGRSASLLGLSDEFTQHFCGSYGAAATVPGDRSAPPSSLATGPGDRPDLLLPEVRVHHLTIDLDRRHKESTAAAPVSSAAGEGGDPFPSSFHLKIFGGAGNGRSLALAVPRCESSVVRALKTVVDQSVMRNIFQECYNKYRSSLETELTDAEAVRCLKFSPRLFEVKLLQRLEPVAYIEDADIFVVAEGETARRVNFCSGMDVNLVVSGLASLASFFRSSVSVNSDKRIVQTLKAKLKHGQTVAQDFVRQGLKDVMYS